MRRRRWMGVLPRAALSAAVASAALTSSAARAAGFYLEDQSTRGSGRAFSGEVSDTGPASLFYNPAAIGGLTGLETANSFTAILADARVSDAGSTITRLGQASAPVGGAPEAFKPVEAGVIPAAALAYGLPRGFAVGLAVSSPFSFATKYPGDTFARYDAETTRLITVDAQPTLAWRPVPWLSLGAGAVVEYADAVFSNALPQLTANGPDGSQYLHGHGWNAGYTAGVQVDPIRRVTVGLAYRSRIDHTLSGQARISGLTGLLALAGANQTLDALARFTTPWTATFGVRWRLTERLTLEGQGVRFGWSDFNQIRLSPAPLPDQAEDYHDTTSGAVGLDYALNPIWTVRAGVQYDPTPTPAVGRDARVPDADRFLFAVGSSVRASRGLTLDGAISYVDFDHSRIDHETSDYAGTPAVTPISVQGEIAASAVTMSAGARYRF